MDAQEDMARAFYEFVYRTYRYLLARGTDEKWREMTTPKVGRIHIVSHVRTNKHFDLVGRLMKMEHEPYPDNEQDDPEFRDADWEPNTRMVYTLRKFDGTEIRWENVELIQANIDLGFHTGF